MGSSQSSDSASGNNESSAAGPSTSLPQALGALRAVRDVRVQSAGADDSESQWKERCPREGYRPRDPSKMNKDWRLFYFMCKKRRNLLKNPRAEHGMTYWKILENGGDGWRVEGLRTPHPNETVQQNFITSFGMCRKSQLIDLEAEGYNPSFMDRFQPEIRISDWYSPRSDCDSEYELRVELLNHKKESVQTFAPDKIYFGPWNEWTEKWNQIIHVFQDYGPGVRYIDFIHGGKDMKFWKGWYGIRVTDSCVEINPAIGS